MNIIHTKIKEDPSNNGLEYICKSESDVSIDSNRYAFNAQLERIDSLIASFYEKKLKFLNEGTYNDEDPNVIKLDSQIKALQNTRPTLIRQLDLMKSHETVVTQKASVVKNLIPSKLIPKFNVNPEAGFINTAESSSSNEGIELNTFFLQFERVFTDHAVDINKEWCRYLAVSFEKVPKFYPWFEMHLKNATSLCWKDAKIRLQPRFDFASQVSVESIVSDIFNFAQGENESFILCLERFRKLVMQSNINFENNVLLIYSFINCLSKPVQEKVKEILRLHQTEIIAASPILSLEPEHKLHPVPASWVVFETVVSTQLGALNSLNSQTQEHIANKKRKRVDQEDP